MNVNGNNHSHSRSKNRQKFHFNRKENSMKEKLTPTQKQEIDRINNMGHYEMCYLWRFALPGHPYFDRTKPYFEVFKKRLFEHFGGFTPEISKSLG